MSFGFLKLASAESLASSGLAASSGAHGYCAIELHQGDEPDEGEEVELHTVPGDTLAMF